MSGLKIVSEPPTGYGSVIEIQSDRLNVVLRSAFALLLFLVTVVIVIACSESRRQDPTFILLAFVMLGIVALVARPAFV